MLVEKKQRRIIKRLKFYKKKKNERGRCHRCRTKGYLSVSKGFPSPQIVTTFCEKGECLDQSRDSIRHMGGLALRPLRDRRCVNHSPKIQLKDTEDRQTNMLNVFINSGLFAGHRNNRMAMFETVGVGQEVRTVSLFCFEGNRYFFFLSLPLVNHTHCLL